MPTLVEMLEIAYGDSMRRLLNEWRMPLTQREENNMPSRSALERERQRQLEYEEEERRQRYQELLLAETREEARRLSNSPSASLGADGRDDVVHTFNPNISYGTPDAYNWSLPPRLTYQGPIPSSWMVEEVHESSEQMIRRLAQEKEALMARKKKAVISVEKLVASKTLCDVESLIKCGFEFEFHKLEGPNSHVFREELFLADRAKWLTKQSLTDLYGKYRRIGGLLGIDPTPDLEQTDEMQFRNVIDYIYRTQARNISDLPRELQEKGAKYLAILQERAIESWNERYRRSYTAPASPLDIAGWSDISEYTEIGEDPSVRGGEIRTHGGRTVREFLRAANVMSRNKFEVDIGCSFHIHLSIAGVEHKWGQRFQAEMYAYILSNLNRLPAPVRERMVAEKGGAKYARFAIENGRKYSAIYQHDDYNTWEFRLFGNITRYTDMARCLKVAVDTIKHAYSVKMGRTPSLLREFDMDRIHYALDAIYSKKDSTTGPFEGLDEPEDVDMSRGLPGEPDGRTVRKGVGPENFWTFLREESDKVRNVESDAA